MDEVSDLHETRRAAETTNGDVRFFYVTLSPSDRDPPVEHPHALHISAMLVVTTIWWPSVELQRCPQNPKTPLDQLNYMNLEELK